MARIAAFFAIEAGWSSDKIRKTRKCELLFYMSGWRLLKADEKRAMDERVRDNSNANSPGSFKGQKVVTEIDIDALLHGKK